MFKKIFRAIILLYILHGISIYFYPTFLNKYYGELQRIYQDKSVSVIIPVRNEESRLIPLLESIKAQDYTNFEVIFVNDSSTDNTVTIINDYLQGMSNVRIVDVKERHDSLTRYQNLLENGVQESKNEILLFTNAGCSFEKDFLKELAAYYVTDDIGAAVISYKANVKSSDFVSVAQYLSESYMSDLCNLAIACDSFLGAKGQAISYSRKVYTELKGQFAVPGQASEDIFFTKKVYESKYKVIAVPMVVHKLSKQTLFSLSMQHVKWLKGLFVHETSTGVVMLSAQYIYHLGSIYLLFNPSLNTVLKLVGDFIFVSNINKNSDAMFKLGDLIHTALIYPFYYISVFTISLVPIDFTWK